MFMMMIPIKRLKTQVPVVGRVLWSCAAASDSGPAGHKIKACIASRGSRQVPRVRSTRRPVKSDFRSSELHGAASGRRTHEPGLGPGQGRAIYAIASTGRRSLYATESPILVLLIRRSATPGRCSETPGERKMAPCTQGRSRNFRKGAGPSPFLHLPFLFSPFHTPPLTLRSKPP